MKRTTKKTNPPEHPVLGACRALSASNFISVAGKNISLDCAAITERSIEVFYHQLVCGLWWEAAKIAAASTDKKSKKSGIGKSAPKEDLYARLKSKFPAIPADRTLNSWGEAFLLGAQAKGLLLLPPRIGQQKQPRPRSVDEFKQLTHAQIRSLALEHENLTQIRKNLRAPDTEKSGVARKKKNREPVSPVKQVAKAVKALTNFEPTPECQPLLLELQQLTAAALDQIS